MKQRDHCSPDRDGTRVQYHAGEPTATDDDPVDAEAWVLTTEAGGPLLADVHWSSHPVPRTSRGSDKRPLPPECPRRFAWSQARHKAALKFERGHQMWVEPTAVEQATAEPVARHKATRFACPLVVDLCAGVGGDALALAVRSDVLAVDLDQGMCRRLVTMPRFTTSPTGSSPFESQAETLAIPAGAWLHLDPDRRASGHERARSLEDYAPGPDFWKSAVRQVAAGAIKLGPASDFAKHFSGPEYEVELISLRGECKEATVWFGELGVVRPPGDGSARECLVDRTRWTDGAMGPRHPDWQLDLRPRPRPDSRRLARWVRAGTRARPGCRWCRLSHRRADDLTPFLTPFHVRDVLPLDLKRLKRVIAGREIGTLEIKVRGADVTPEAIRARA